MRLPPARCSFDLGAGERRVANVATPGGQERSGDVALDGLANELPRARSVSLVVSWFGDDLRAGACTVTPRVEQAEQDGDGMAWAVSGVSRGAAEVVPLDGRQPGLWRHALPMPRWSRRSPSWRRAGWR